MNQDKLEVVKKEMEKKKKKEMARVNTDILRINKVKWTGMGEFNSDDHYIYYCGQESLRRNTVAFIVNKSNQVIQVYAATTNDKGEVNQFYKDLQHSSQSILKEFNP